MIFIQPLLLRFIAHARAYRGPRLQPQRESGPVETGPTVPVATALLSAYHYTIRYKAGKYLSNADAFSRLPRAVTIANDHVPEELELLMNHLSATSIGAVNIKARTNRDPFLVMRL